MKNKILHTLLTLTTLFLTAGWAHAASDKAAQRVNNVIWANGLIYDTVLTTNSFKMPPAHSVDMLYNFGMSGLEGQRPVSDAAPGDRNYNGGRWAVTVVIFTEAGLAAHDPDGDGIVNFELTSAEMVLHHVGLGHLELVPTEIFFSCPLAGPGE